jgi:hypothetical protein
MQQIKGVHLTFVLVIGWLRVSAWDTYLGE